MKSKALLAVALLVFIAAPGSLLGRGGGGGFGGGGHSFSSGSSFSGGSRSSSFSSAATSRSGGYSSSSFSSSNTATGSRSSWGTSSRFSNNATSRAQNGFSASSSRSETFAGSRTDSALAQKVGQGGARFSSRSEATHDFQQKYAASYPTTFPREPSVRPMYVPQTMIFGGRSYPVYYDWYYGRYGYWNGSTWTAYDVMQDALMLDFLMNQHNYNYDNGQSVPYYPSSPPVNYQSYPQSSFGGTFLGLFFLFGGIFVGIFFIAILFAGATVVSKVAHF